MTAGIAHGANAAKFAKRNPPTIAYAQFSPVPRWDNEAQTLLGGQFLDQRVSTLADQALMPFLGEAEMANTSEAQVLTKLQARPYAGDFRAVFGANVFSESSAYRKIGEAIQEFERRASLSPFTSKFDYYRRGKTNLSDSEQLGLTLFNGKAGCAACHPSAGVAPLFTDFTNDNIGVPKNLNNPFYSQAASINPDGAAFIDRGLGETLGDAAYNGRFKVPTLRNVAVTGPYMHNGVFTSLKQVVQFYNTACAADNPDGWAPPEVSATQNCKELGDLKLSATEIDAIVDFLRTLTDGYNP